MDLPREPWLMTSLRVFDTMSRQCGAPGSDIAYTSIKGHGYTDLLMQIGLRKYSLKQYAYNVAAFKQQITVNDNDYIGFKHSETLHTTGCPFRPTSKRVPYTAHQLGLGNMILHVARHTLASFHVGCFQLLLDSFPVLDAAVLNTQECPMLPSILACSSTVYISTFSHLYFHLRQDGRVRENCVVL